MVPKWSKMKPLTRVIKLFMKEATVKTRENCSSWRLQSETQTRKMSEAGPSDCSWNRLDDVGQHYRWEEVKLTQDLSSVGFCRVGAQRAEVVL